MALMVAMILIIGIFVVGKMLGYGSTKNLYLLEGYGDDDDDDDYIEGMEDEEEEEIDEGFGADIEDVDVDVDENEEEGFIEESARRAKRKCPEQLKIRNSCFDKHPKAAHPHKCKNAIRGFNSCMKNPKKTETFTCGANSDITAYDKDAVFASF